MDRHQSVHSVCHGRAGTVAYVDVWQPGQEDVHQIWVILRGRDAANNLGAYDAFSCVPAFNSRTVYSQSPIILNQASHTHHWACAAFEPPLASSALPCGLESAHLCDGRWPAFSQAPSALIYASAFSQAPSALIYASASSQAPSALGDVESTERSAR